MPSSGPGGIPPYGWNIMPNGTVIGAGTPGVNNATFGGGQPGDAVAGSGMQYGASAGANAAGGGFGIPDSHNPVAGGVPVLPHVSAPLSYSYLRILQWFK